MERSLKIQEQMLQEQRQNREQIALLRNSQAQESRTMLNATKQIYQQIVPGQGPGKQAVQMPNRTVISTTAQAAAQQKPEMQT